MVSKAAVVETVASAQSIEKRECGGWAQRRSPSGREDGEGTREEARDTQATKAKLQRMRGSTAVKESEEVIQAGDDVAVNPDPARRHLTSKVRCTTEKFPSGEAFGCCKAVLPMALPGEAHNMSFGAAAKAVVLVSGSSRLLVSRCSAAIRHENSCWQPSLMFVLLVFRPEAILSSMTTWPIHCRIEN